MPDSDRVLLLVMRDVTPTEPQAGQLVIGECVGFDGAPLSGLCHVVRGIHPVTKQLAWYVVGGGGLPPMGIPARWAAMPQDQGLTIGDVLGALESCIGPTFDKLRAAVSDA